MALNLSNMKKFALDMTEDDFNVVTAAVERPVQPKVNTAPVSKSSEQKIRNCAALSDELKRKLDLYCVKSGVKCTSFLQECIVRALDEDNIKLSHTMDSKVDDELLGSNFIQVYLPESLSKRLRSYCKERKMKVKRFIAVVAAQAIN